MKTAQTDFLPSMIAIDSFLHHLSATSSLSLHSAHRHAQSIVRQLTGSTREHQVHLCHRAKTLGSVALEKV
jgi:hypothetical protein